MATFTDDFNRANSTGLGGSWTALVGNLDVLSNEAHSESSHGTGRCRLDSDLSGADHYAQAEITQLTAFTGDAVGLCVQYSSSADDCYIYYLRSAGNNQRVFKITAGSLSQLGATNNTAPPSAPFTMRLEFDGTDTLDCIIDSVSQMTRTDSSSQFTANRRAGIFATALSSSREQSIDDFECGDLSGGVGSSVPVFYHHLRTLAQA